MACLAVKPKHEFSYFQFVPFCISKFCTHIHKIIIFKAFAFDHSCFSKTVIVIFFL